MMTTLKKGFTLVETLVAISILMVSIVGPMYSVFQAVQVTYIARDQLIATSLAQEGVEYVRHRRDSNYLATLVTPGSTTWLGGLDNCMLGKICTVDVISDITPPATCNGTCPVLNLSTNTGLYTQASGVGIVATRFTRSVQITTVSADEIVVAVTVSWINSRIPFSITVTEHLYNWL